jgi:UDP:flavonoid glycosyltransferase YjiC (YdhE family)
MMQRRVLLFAPAAFNLAETSRMVEIAKGVAGHEHASQQFDIHFISDGGEFESLIEKHGFALTRMEPRLTPEKIEFIMKVDRGEKLAPALNDDEISARLAGEVRLLKELQPAAVVTGSYVTIPLSCRISGTPLVWVIQTTWLPQFFEHGAGMTDWLGKGPVRTVADRLMLAFIKFWINRGFLDGLNRAARRQGVAGFTSIFDFWRGDITLVAEPPQFSGVELPPGHFFIGPLIPKDEFSIPPEILALPHDKPLIYFAMGSSGTTEIVVNIIKSFEGKPCRVIAPVKFHLAKAPEMHVPPNVIVTDWLPALEANRQADLAVIHGGIGMVMAAALAGKPVVGVGMQIEQVANLACLERLGFAIRISKSKDPSSQIQVAIGEMLGNKEAKRKAEAFALSIAGWDGPGRAAELLLKRYGNKTLS